MQTNALVCADLCPSVRCVTYPDHGTPNGEIRHAPAACGSLLAVRFAIPLLILSILAAIWLAYGMDPAVAVEFGGLPMIALTRRLQWLLLIAAIAPCLAMIVVVAMNRARAWWLLGLSIVVAMLFVRFGSDARKPVRILEAPAMPTLKESTLPTEEEWVVGVVFEDDAYAFPYRSLLRTPIVQLTDFDKRLLLIHSPYANSATALDVTREVRASDLEFVASPGNSTLVYNRKYGQFIVGLTGKTETGEDPTGIRGRVATYRMPLMLWRRLYPESKLMIPNAADGALPGVEIKMKYPARIPDTSMPDDTRIVLLHTHPPASLLSGDYDRPTHTRAGDKPIVLWRDRGVLRAFGRTIDGDLFLTFKVTKDKKGKAQLIDNQTGSVWSYNGTCVSGALDGKKLPTVMVEEGVYWGVSREWFADLELIRQER